MATFGELVRLGETENHIERRQEHGGRIAIINTVSKFTVRVTGSQWAELAPLSPDCQVWPCWFDELSKWAEVTK